MTFGVASEIFRAHIADVWGGSAFNYSTDTIRAAIYNNTPTPNQDVATAATGYGAVGSQWVTSSEVADGSEWPAGGLALAGKSIDSTGAGVVFLDANDAASGASATLADVRGVLVYDDTLSGKPGICYLSFGGAQAVTDGQFTVVFAAAGIARITL